MFSGINLNLTLGDYMRKQTPSLEEKLKDENYSLEDYLKDDEAKFSLN